MATFFQNTTKRLIGLLVVLALSATLTANAQNTLRIALSGEGDTLDPAYFSFTSSFSIATNVFSALVRYEPGTINVVPDLATSWETSGDGLQWVFTIRDDIQWHGDNGYLVAQDIVDSFERVRDPEVGSRWQSELAVIDTITAPDSTTVVFNLHRPSAAFLHTVAAFRQGLIVHTESAAELGDDYGRAPIGTGPFEFVEWIPGVQVTLKAFDDYFLGRPEIDEVQFIVISDETVRMLALENGEVDIAMGLQNPEIYERLRQHPNINTGEVNTSSSVGFVVNMQEEPFDNVLVRRALLHALDLELITEVIWAGLATPAYTDLAPPLLGHTDQVPGYEYNPEKARELLAEAGYPDGISFKLHWLNTYSHELLGTVRAMWREAGIDAEPVLVDSGNWVRTLVNGEHKIILSMANRVDPHVWYSTFYHSSGFPPGMNGSYYAGIDDLIEAGGVEADPEKRAEIYRAAQVRMMTDLPYLPMYWPMEAHPYRDYVSGWVGPQLHDAWLFPVSLTH